MEIVLRRHPRSLTNGDGIVLAFDRYYPIGDGVHRFIVRDLGTTTLVQIKQGNRTVQQGRVRNDLSLTSGRRSNGSARVQSYRITLNPEQEIFPISSLVEELSKLGIEPSSISPMFDPELSDCVASHASPHMVSDGDVARLSLPGGGDRLPATQFEVTSASWAVRYTGQPDSHSIHVYLWMTASVEAGNILTEVKKIQAGASMMPIYA